MEYWIEVKGHPRYMVSTLGKVKCLNWNNTGKERICKLGDNGNGYLTACIDGKRKYVHRLVLESFIPNPQNKPCIDHINTEKKDCRLENLRWVTYSENSKNPLSLKHLSENNPMLGKFGAEHHNSICVVQMTKDDVFVKKWHCATDVQRELGIFKSSIAACCKGKRNSAGGYKWMYATDYIPVKRSISEIRPLF